MVSGNRVAKMVEMRYNYTSSNQIVDHGASGIARGLSKFCKGELTMTDHTSTSSALKVCSRCKESKPLTEFTQRKSGQRVGTYEGRCKECLRLTSAEYRARHPERVVESRARTQDKYREQRNAEYRDRLAADLEYRKKRNDKSRAWRERNRDRIAEYNAARFDEKPEAMRAAIRASDKRNPNRSRAHKAVQYAVKTGKLPPAWSVVCECCQEAAAANYHHHKGYEQEFRLDVVALCTECHGKAHWVD
jgi:hypothetical protein